MSRQHSDSLLSLVLYTPRDSTPSLTQFGRNAHALTHFQTAHITDADDKLKGTEKEGKEYGSHNTKDLK